MALGHAILAALMDEPQTGYDLAKQFGTDGYFWRATHQQIYRELAKLETDGDIAPTEQKAGPRGDRKLFITTPGRQTLASWAREASGPATIKEDILVKCLALDLIDPGDLCDQIRAHRAQHEVRCRNHSAILAEHFSAGAPTDRTALGRYLALVGGVAYERAWVEWADVALAAIASSAPPTS